MSKEFRIELGNAIQEPPCGHHLVDIETNVKQQNLVTVRCQVCGLGWPVKAVIILD